jgi:hypothetical protein
LEEISLLLESYNRIYESPLQVDSPQFDIVNVFPEHAVKVQDTVFCRALFVFVAENGAHWTSLVVG